MEKKKINAVDLLLSKLDRKQIENFIRAMKARYQLLLILSALSLVMTGCGNEEDMKPIDLTLFAGTWEVVRQGDQNIFKREEILHITSSRINEGYEDYQGNITTYFLSSNDTPWYDQDFTWSIPEVDDNRPLLNVTLQGAPDSNGVPERDHSYRIVKLTDSHMWWQLETDGDDGIIMLRRRNDILIE